MRVGLDVNPLETHKSRGIGHYVANLLKSLKDIEAPVDFFLYYADWKGEPTSQGNPRFRFRRVERGARSLSHFTAKDSLDVLHLTDYHFPLAAVQELLSSPFSSVRLITTVFDLNPYHNPNKSPREVALMESNLKPLMDRLDRIIVLSENGKKDLVHFWKVRAEKVIPIPLGVDPARFSCPLRRGEVDRARRQYGITSKYILYVGGIDWNKNLVTLLEAYKLFRLDSPAPYELVLVGNHFQNPKALPENIKKGLGPGVKLTGFVPVKDLVALYQGAEIFVFPSIHEGFGLPVVEAMACGTPVVAFKSSCLPEVIGDAGLLVEPCHASALKEAMLNLVTNEHLYSTLKSRGLARSREFTWTRTARCTLDVYTSV